MASIQVVDHEFESAYTRYFAETEKLEDVIMTQIELIFSVVEERALEGEAADRLLDFANIAQDYLAGELSTLMQTHQNRTKAFIDNTIADDEAVIA